MNPINYDYKMRKKEVEAILDNTDAVNEKVKQFPRDEDFTYTNGYKAWASSIFIDLRNSTKLFNEHNDVDISKVIRGFTSGIIEILRNGLDDRDLKEIGIRGDCVYAVYSTPWRSDIYEVAARAFYVNTYMKMLNELLSERGLPNIEAGIGLASSPTLAVKAGRKSSGINNLVWIGESVSMASNLSDLGNKGLVNPIVMTGMFYDDVMDELKDNHPKIYQRLLPLFKRESNKKNGTYYHANIIITDFNEWILDGMR